MHKERPRIRVTKEGTETCFELMRDQMKLTDASRLQIMEWIDECNMALRDDRPFYIEGVVLDSLVDKVEFGCQAFSSLRY